MAVYPSRTLSVSIDRDWREVYDFASIPKNLARWAAGLGNAAVLRDLDPLETLVGR